LSYRRGISGLSGWKQYLLILPILGSILPVVSCSQVSYTGKAETLTLAAVPTELNALVYVAEDKEFFSNNGIEIAFKEYDSGATSAAGMLNGEADIALAAEFPIVRQVFNREDIVNFGTVARYENTYIIWRSDSGIKTIADLKGKRVGVTLTTISEFYLGRTLQLNGVDIHQVILVDTKAADAEKALANGEVDAVVTWEPWVTQVNQRFGKEAITKPAQSDQYAYWNLVTTSSWATNHPDTMERLLKALARADEYVAGHQDEAKAIVRKRMSFDSAYMETIWPQYQFSLSLDQSLITAMEDEARWMIENNLTTEKQVPNFNNYIYEDALKAIKPEAVNIIR
jgi:NitT/TauT family transport system substrate-binding protein